MNSIKLLFVTAILFSLSVNAQLDKKTWLVGGSGSFDSYRQEYNIQLQPQPINSSFDHKEINITAIIGYFVINKLAIGIKPEFLYHTYFMTGSPNSGIGESPAKLIIGPFIRYYLLNKEKPFNVFAEASYQTGMNNYTTVQLKSKGNYSKFTVMAGTEIFFNSSVGVELSLGYKTTKETMNEPITPYTDIRKGFQMGVGFKIHLEKL